MKKALFIDRDGTIIAEPADEQIDSLEKLAFVPGAISALKALTGLGFDLVLATNQDGLGTPSFPEDTFWPAHNKMLATLGGEGVAFDDQLIDRTFEADAAPTRKPRTGMFGRYTGGEYDLAASYVIGDRATDILLARNLGARGILLAPPAEGLRTLEEAGAADACALITDSWSEIAEFIRRGERRAEIRRETRETQITVRLDLDGRGDFNGQISTGLRFLDHMLAQIAHHGGVALAVDARGDLDIDEHHTMEDVAITLGEAVDRALGAKAGIARYGFALPMDDCRALTRSTSGAASTSSGTPRSAASGLATFRPKCSATSSTRSHAPRGATSKSRPAATTTTTRPRPSSRPSPAPCAWPWRTSRSITPSPAAKESYDSRRRLRHGQPAVGCRRPSPRRGPNSRSRPIPPCCAGPTK